MKLTTILLSLSFNLVLANLNHFVGEAPEDEQNTELLPQKPSKLETNNCDRICQTNPTNANQQGCLCFAPNNQSQVRGIVLPNSLNFNSAGPTPNSVANPNQSTATVVVFTTNDPNGQAIPVSTATVLPTAGSMNNNNNINVNNLPLPNSNVNPSNSNSNKWFPALNANPKVASIAKGWQSNTYFANPTNRNFAQMSTAMSSNKVSATISGNVKSAMPTSKASAMSSKSNGPSSNSKGSNSADSGAALVIGDSIIFLFVALISFF